MAKAEYSREQYAAVRISENFGLQPERQQESSRSQDNHAQNESMTAGQEAQKGAFSLSEHVYIPRGGYIDSDKMSERLCAAIAKGLAVERFDEYGFREQLSHRVIKVFSRKR